MLKIIVAAFFGTLFSTAAFAQVQSSDSETPSNPFANLAETQKTVVAFDGVSAKVIGMFKDPSQEGAVRVVVQLISTADEDRFLALLAPAATLVDSVGNEHVVQAVAGFEYCTFNGRSNSDLDYCVESRKRDFTRVTSGGVATLGFLFTASEENYSSELAQFATQGFLRARVGYYKVDSEEAGSFDILLNNIAFSN